MFRYDGRFPAKRLSSRNDYLFLRNLAAERHAPGNFAVAKNSQSVTLFPQLRCEQVIGTVVARSSRVDSPVYQGQQQAHQLRQPGQQRDAATNGECDDRGDQISSSPVSAAKITG